MQTFEKILESIGAFLLAVILVVAIAIFLIVSSPFLLIYSIAELYDNFVIDIWK